MGECGDECVERVKGRVGKERVEHVGECVGRSISICVCVWVWVGMDSAVSMSRCYCVCPGLSSR